MQPPRRLRRWLKWENSCWLFLGFSRWPQPGAPAGSADLHGLVGVVQLGASALSVGATTFLSVVALITNLSIAVLNLLPVPILDGAQLVYLVVEKVQGKPLSQKLQSRAVDLRRTAVSGGAVFDRALQRSLQADSGSVWLRCIAHFAARADRLDKAGPLASFASCTDMSREDEEVLMPERARELVESWLTNFVSKDAGD